MPLCFALYDIFFNKEGCKSCICITVLEQQRYLVYDKSMALCFVLYDYLITKEDVNHVMLLRKPVNAEYLTFVSPLYKDIIVSCNGND